ADQNTYTQLQANLNTLALQFGALNPSAFGVAANEGLWNVLGADVLPRYFLGLTNATDQLLETNGYVKAAPRAAIEISHTSVSTFNTHDSLASAPQLFGLTLADLLLATHDQLKLIEKIYGQYFEYLLKSIATLSASRAFQAVKGGIQLDGIITGASLSFHVFDATNSVIESSVVNLMVRRNDVYIIGPNQVSTVQEVISHWKIPNNSSEENQQFQKIVDALNQIN